MDTIISINQKMQLIVKYFLEILANNEQKPFFLLAKLCHSKLLAHNITSSETYSAFSLDMFICRCGVPSQ